LSACAAAESMMSFNHMIITLFGTHSLIFTLSWIIYYC